MGVQPTADGHHGRAHEFAHGHEQLEHKNLLLNFDLAGVNPCASINLDEEATR